MTLHELDAGRLQELGRELRREPFPEVFLDWPEFWARDRRDAEWLVEPILARGRGHSIYAQHKVGKSLLMQHLAAGLAQRADVLAMYFDYEMSEDDLYERLEDMGYGPESDLDRLRYALLPSLPPLDSQEGGRAIAEILDYELAVAPDLHPVVVIDTIGRALQGEENPADTIRDFYRYTGVELKRRRVTWARLDHAGWDATKGARGSSAKGDDVDVIWRLLATEGGLELVKVAARMGWIPEKVPLRKETDPVLRFAACETSWPAGTVETAGLLDDLGVSLDASRRQAQSALKAAGQGRRAEVIAAAQRHRRISRGGGP
jgi:hypothetical protein